MSSPDRRWYPVQTQPLRERLAAQQLENQGYEVFLPRRRATVRHARRLQHRDASYFPGYLFVRLDLETEQWRSVNGTFGVKSLIMFGGRPAAVPAEFVELLKSTADPEGFVAVEDALQAGDKVQIMSGPFVDVIGMIDRLEGSARVRVLLDLASGSLPIVTSTRNIALAS